MSEQDWQVTVLAELGMPPSGLVTADPAVGEPVVADLVDAVDPVVEDRVAARPPAEPSDPPGDGRATPFGNPRTGRSEPAPPPPAAVPGGFPAIEPEAPNAPPEDGPAWASWAESPQASWAEDPGTEPSQPVESPEQAAWDQAAQEPWGPTAPPTPPAPEPEGSDPPYAPAPAPPRLPGFGGPRPPAGLWPPGEPGPPGGALAARDLIRRSAHGDPLVRRMSRGVRRAVGVSAANDVRKAADVQAVLGRPVPSCRQIAVTSIRGGAGKTTVAGLTATAIAQYRPDRVLAVDADSGLGSLPLRMGVDPELSLHDLASARPRSFEDATRYLAHTGDGLWVLSGTAGGRITGELDLATFRAAAGTMTRYFSAAVIDCGAGLLPELQRGILADAHAQVMVTPGTVDGALSAQGALDWQARNGYEYLLDRTVVAFVTHTPHVDADLGRAARMLSAGGLPVVHVSYDRHLAAGTAVESARIGQDTRAAMIRIAVEAFARATSG